MNNGTFILQTLGPEFRIAHLENIEDIYKEWKDTGEWEPCCETILSFFGKSSVYTDLTEAWDAATMIDNSVPDSEFGVSLVTDFESINFEDIQTHGNHDENHKS